MANTARTCGSCTFCCKIFNVEELGKPAGTWCPHCAIGSGCGAYDSRPASCREFACHWLADEKMPDALRPDRTKVVMTAQMPGPTIIAHCDPATPLAWRKDPIYSFLKNQARLSWGTEITILAKAGDRQWLIAPAEDVDMGDLAPGTPFRIEQGVDGKVKVRLLPPPPAPPPKTPS
jgi:hypothetical protein